MSSTETVVLGSRLVGAALPACLHYPSFPPSLDRKGKRGRGNVEGSAELNHWSMGRAEVGTSSSQGADLACCLRFKIGLGLALP